MRPCWTRKEHSGEWWQIRLGRQARIGFQLLIKSLSENWRLKRKKMGGGGRRLRILSSRAIETKLVPKSI